LFIGMLMPAIRAIKIPLIRACADDSTAREKAEEYN
jgi:hypothetical protein